MLDSASDWKCCAARSRNRTKVSELCRLMASFRQPASNSISAKKWLRLETASVRGQRHVEKLQAQCPFIACARLWERSPQFMLRFATLAEAEYPLTYKNCPPKEDTLHLHMQLA